MSNEKVTDMLHLLRMEYDDGNQFIRSLVGTVTTVRGWTITLSLAVLGLAPNRAVWQRGLLAIGVVCLFAIVDIYDSWLYTQVLSRVQAIDRIFGLYYRALARGEDDPKVTEEFEIELVAYKFGLMSSLPRFAFRRIGETRPLTVIVLLYGSLALISLVYTFLPTLRDL